MSPLQIRPCLRLLFPSAHRERIDDIDCDSRDLPCARLERQQFDAMSAAFRPHGGFANGDDVTRRLGRLPDRSSPTLERWLASRQILNVWWRGRTLMPMFQFDLEDMSIRPACARVVSELQAVFDDWELALWFATPNHWLADAAPVTLLARDHAAVLQAARADRFISRG